MSNQGFFARRVLVGTILATAFGTVQYQSGTGGIKHQIAIDGVTKWGVIASGGRGYQDYHLQADVCHAYQILHHHGIPDDHIVVMMYDDIAYNTQNPTPGIVVNYLDGRDHYKGTVKDYTGVNLTVNNFLNVLQGRQEFIKGGSGKVCESGQNDHIFVYLNGPGARGLVSFPDGPLHAKDLTDTIKRMHNDKKYARMVFYLYGSYSGSMFEGLLPNNVSVFATTAANPYEESCPSEWDEVRGVFVGDYYSVAWMRNTEAEFYRRRTLQEQFEDTRFETIFSTVSEYGDMGMKSMKVSDFQGSHVIPPPPERSPRLFSKGGTNCITPMDMLRKQLRNTTELGKRAAINQKLRLVALRRNFFKAKLTQIITHAKGCGINDCEWVLHSERRLTKHACYKQAVEYFNTRCFQLSRNTYVLRYLGAFINLCEEGVLIQNIRRAMNRACSHSRIVDIV